MTPGLILIIALGAVTCLCLLGGALYYRWRGRQQRREVKRWIGIRERTKSSYWGKDT